MIIHPKVVKFIKKNHVAAVSAQNGGGTWSFNCFYTFLETDPHIIFLSNDNTAHARFLAQNPHVSGTISAQTKTVAAIQGVQFTGFAIRPQCGEFRTIYNKRFPFAMAVEAPLWILRLDMIKYTSNIITFGDKIYWERVCD